MKPHKDNTGGFAGNEYIYLTVLIALAGFLYLLQLGGMALWDTDEALYTQIAREMQQTGDYLTTSWNHQPWFCHPPLYFWLTVISAKLFGWTAFAVRFPSALFGIFTIVLVYFFGRLVFTPRAGFYAGLICVTTLQLWLQSRMAILDMPFLFFILLAVYLFYRAKLDKQAGWSILGFWAACGLAVIAKGPVGVILPLIYAGIIILLEKRWNLIKPVVLNPGVLLFLLISVPWYLGMVQVYKEPFVEQVFGYFFVARIFKPVMNQGGTWYYYIPYFLAGFLPWTAFLPLTLYGMVKRFSDSRSKFLLAWIVGTFLIFTLAGTKRPNYILFLYPWHSLALGWILDDSLNNGKFNRAFQWSFGAFSLSAVLVISAFGFAAARLYPDYWSKYSSNLTPLGIALIAGGIITLVLTFRNKRYALYSVLTMTCIAFLMLTSYIPLVESLRPEPRLAKVVRESMGPRDRLAMRGNFGRQFSILFYAGKYVHFYHSDEDLIKILNNRPERYYVIMHKKNFNRVKEKITVPRKEIKSDGGLVLFLTDPDPPHAFTNYCPIMKVDQ